MLIQPLFYFPSTMIAVDDQPNTLLSVNLLFEKNYQMRTFQDPQNALDDLTNYRPPLSQIPFLRAATENMNSDLLENCPVDFNVLNIAQLAEYAERQKEISVLIIDFNMPGMNGLEVCRALQDTPMKKILLTGDSNYQEAIAAFNGRIIDHFIHKGSATLTEELTRSVQNLTTQYFYERSQALLAHLETYKPLPLSDPKFIAFFEAWCQKNTIREYYLMDRTGSFLCINAQGKTLHFVVHTDNTLNTFVDLYDDETRDELPALLQSVRDRQKIPFFGLGRSSWQVDISVWGQYFYSAEVLEGRENYYWTVI